MKFKKPELNLQNLEPKEKKVLQFGNNTPAVHFCHGWKLGEYFCLGKIILSTNFQNNIPNGIQDRKNILFVDPKNIEEIINTITNDISFQNELQQNALSYWKNSACPQKVIEHLISYSNRKL